MANTYIEYRERRRDSMGISLTATTGEQQEQWNVAFLLSQKPQRQTSAKNGSSSESQIKRPNQENQNGNGGIPFDENDDGWMGFD